MKASKAHMIRIGQALIGATLAVSLLAIGNPVSADSAPARIQITVDDTAVRQLIALAAAKDASDEHVEAWLDLPANKYILRIGEREGNLSRAQLKASAVAVINGVATPKTQPRNSIDCLLLDPDGSYDKMLDELRRSLPDRLTRIIARDTAFNASRSDVEETVYLHLGGEWDAVSEGHSIYCNVRFWHDFHYPSWDGFNMVVAHETMHTIQNSTYGNPEAQDSGDGSFLTALSKIQREGTATYVEYDTDPAPYLDDSYGFFYRGKDEERLRAFPADIALLKPLYASCFPIFDHKAFVNACMPYLIAGGPFYDIGHGMARAIDEKLGRKVLLETIRKGPKEFFTQYGKACQRDSSLPKLPVEVVEQVKKMPAKLESPAPANGASAAHQ